MKKLLLVVMILSAVSVGASHRRPRPRHDRGYSAGVFDGMIISTYFLFSIAHDGHRYNQELAQLDAIDAVNNQEMFGELEMNDALSELVSKIQDTKTELSEEEIVEALANGEGLELK